MSDDSVPRIRAEAIESLLIERGLMPEGAVDEVIDTFNERIGPMNGAQVVARAWSEPDFRSRLLADGSAAVAEYAFEGGQVDKLVVVENTDDVHNVLVCTLCSCYPRMLLGQSPAWYKSKAYRSRVVREPRSVLAEFGVELGEGITVRVHDSTAELRYLVLPQRPAGTDGWSVERLASLVTRDSLIGTQRTLDN